MAFALSAVARIPPEIWTMVFEEASDHGEYRWFVQPLLTVCKTWRDCALPCFHRKFEFWFDKDEDPLSSVMKLVGCLFESNDSGRRNGRWIETLHLTSDGNVLSISIIGALLFHFLENLQELECLMDIDLRDFFYICMDGMASTVWILNEFVALDYLRIDGESFDEELSSDSTISLRLPALRHLRLNLDSDHGITFLEVLSNSIFPSLEHLELDWEDVTAAQVENMTPFLNAHRTCLNQLTLCGSASSSPLFLSIAPSPWVSLSVVKFTAFILQPEPLLHVNILFVWPTSARILGLEPDDRYLEADLETLCSALDSSTRKIALQEIRLGDHCFATRTPKYSDRVLDLISRIAKHGVVVTDRHGGVAGRRSDEPGGGAGDSS